jgi:hypothetical protein
MWLKKYEENSRVAMEEAQFNTTTNYIQKQRKLKSKHRIATTRQ